ncbi:MAG: patatin-like phospholipase family protein, partial [Fimbriimonadaceae bacterium]|nr:patatin-like phospholipase family protein [Chitinophagales bacterium]
MHNIGITLSGGGARGIAHTGVLQCLEDNGIYPEIISGCSAGALIGSLYAQGLPPQEIFQFVEKKSLYSIVKMGMPNKGMMELSYFRQVLQKNIPHDSFEQLKKPFHLSVTNLYKGTSEIISSGKLIDYVIASASIPLAFKPVHIGKYLYTDGGVINNLPTEPVRPHCNFLIGVNVNPIKYTEQLAGMWDVGFRVLFLTLMVNSAENKKACDILIEPDVEQYTLFSVNKAKELYDLGYAATKRSIPQLKEKLAKAAGSGTGYTS